MSSLSNRQNTLPSGEPTGFGRLSHRPYFRIFPWLHTKRRTNRKAFREPGQCAYKLPAPLSKHINRTSSSHDKSAHNRLGCLYFICRRPCSVAAEVSRRLIGPFYIAEAAICIPICIWPFTLIDQDIYAEPAHRTLRPAGMALRES